jgi:ABC-type transport system substrate-binding protein
MSKRFASVAALVAVAALLTAVTAGGASGASPGATFTYASQNTIVTDFDPATSYSNEVIAMNNIYEQLTRYDVESKSVKPLLATRWVSSAGGKTWTFTLRSGVKFHTGRPVNAQAAKAAIERTIKLKGGPAEPFNAETRPLKSIASATALRTRTSLSGPDCVFSIASRFWNDEPCWVARLRFDAAAAKSCGVSREENVSSPDCSSCDCVVGCGTNWKSTLV